jgi:hypothetical protein
MMTNEIKRYAVVVGNEIINIILWDGVSVYDTNGKIVSIGGLEIEPSIGWLFQNNEWTKPVSSEPQKDAN